jgi:hypothetical protein
MYFCDVITQGVTNVVFPDQIGWREQRVGIDVDNERPHSSKMSVQCLEDTKFPRMPHSPYSPDVAPSDLYLLSNVKQRLQTCQNPSFEELRDNGGEIFGSIARDELKRLMRAWMDRVRKVIHLGGGDV